MAKVTSVYEGKIEEEAGRSWVARENAISLDIVKEKEDQDQDMNSEEERRAKEVEKQEAIVIDVDGKEENSETETEAQAEALVEEDAEGEASGGGRGECNWPSGWYDGIDDWPMTWSYQEEWLWMGRELGLRLNDPLWEYLSGVGWIDKRP